MVLFISVKFLERNDDIVVMHEDVLVLKRYMPMYLGIKTHWKREGRISELQGKDEGVGVRRRACRILLDGM